MVYNKKLVIPTVRELFRSVRTVGEDWKLKTPLQKWSFLYAIGRASSIIIRVSIYSDDQTLSWWAFQGCVYFGIYFLLGVYTVYYYFMHGEVTKSLPCTCLLVGPVISAMPLYFSALTKRRYEIHKGFEYAGRYIFQDDSEDMEYTKICSKFMDVAMKNFSIRMIIITLSVVAMNIGATYAFLFKGIKTTVVDVRIPFTEERSYEEFFGNIVVHLWMGIYGTFGYLALEIGMELLVGVVAMAPRLVEYEFRKLDQNINKNLFTKLQKRLTFRNIVQQIMDVDDYAIAVKDLGYWRSLLMPPLFVYSIGMSIFCHYALGFVSGYGIAVMSYVQLFFACYLGEIFQDNGMGAVIYNSNWYALPIEQQKDLMHLLNRIQNGVSISMGPFSAVNNECFYAISNKIYSLVMFLLNFFE